MGGAPMLQRACWRGVCPSVLVHQLPNAAFAFAASTVQAAAFSAGNVTGGMSPMSITKLGPQAKVCGAAPSASTLLELPMGPERVLVATSLLVSLPLSLLKRACAVTAPTPARFAALAPKVTIMNVNFAENTASNDAPAKAILIEYNSTGVATLTRNRFAAGEVSRAPLPRCRCRMSLQ